MNATLRTTLPVVTRGIQPKAVRKLVLALVLALLLCLAALAVCASADTATPSFNTVLGRPTDNSVTANVIPDAHGEAYLEYGPSSGQYTTGQTSHFSCVSGQPAEVVMNGLSGDTRYYYRLQFKASGSDDWAAGA
jgi:hypothetical protein